MAPGVISHSADELAIEVLRPDGSSVGTTWGEFDEAVLFFEEQFRDRAGGESVHLLTGCQDSFTVAAAIASINLSIPVLPVDPALADSEFQRVVSQLPTSSDVFLIDGTSITRIQERSRNGGGFSGGLPQYFTLSGGSTGLPRLVMPAHRATRDDSRLFLRQLDWLPELRQLIVGPVWHAAAFSTLVNTVLQSRSTLILDRFSPRLVADAIHSGRAEWVHMASIHLRWCAQAIAARPVPDRLRAIVHTSGPCPVPTKRAWIDHIGAHRVLEYYGGSEAIGVTIIRGTEWEHHVGSVGRGFFTTVRIVDDDGLPTPPGTTGTVVMRSAATGQFLSLGDFGRLDPQNYLFLESRRTDMILVGDANVYPAEIEDVMSTMSGVHDVAVVARDDTILGSVPIAIVVPHDDVTADEILAACRRELTGEKVPRQILFVSSLPRAENGKLRRDLLPAIEGDQR